MSTRGASAIQTVDWDTVNLLRPFFDKGPEPMGARLLDFPMLRGAWAASVVSGGDWYDISGEGRHLTYNGNPTFNYDGLVPYWDYDGTGDFHNRATEAHLNITGLETYVAAAVRGLTMGAWCWIDAIPAQRGLMGKFNAGTNNRSYLLTIDSAAQASFYISNNGVAVETIAGAIPGLSQWIHIAARFDPSTEKAIFVNGVRTSAGTAYASLFSGNAAFTIATYDGSGLYLDGRVAYPFLCAAALSDTHVSVFYHMTKRYFGH